MNSIANRIDTLSNNESINNKKKLYSIEQTAINLGKECTTEEMGLCDNTTHKIDSAKNGRKVSQ